MTEPDKKNIPERVSALEAEVREVRVLAVGADHDVSNMEATLRAHIDTLNSLRETQIEQGQGLSSLRQTQLEHGERLDRLERKVDGLESKVEERFDKVDQRFDKVDDRFGKVDDRFDKVDDRFDKVEGELGKIHSGIAGITALLTDKPGAE